MDSSEIMNCEEVFSAKNKILIADDNRQIRQLFRMFLSKQGYKVLEALNGFEAIEVTEKENPKVILLDIWMPVMDGITACRRLKNRKSTKHIPIVMITGLSEEKRQAIAAGAVDFLQKPFGMEEISMRIESILSGTKGQPHPFPLLS